MNACTQIVTIYEVRVYLFIFFTLLSSKLFPMYLPTTRIFLRYLSLNSGSSISNQIKINLRNVGLKIFVGFMMASGHHIQISLYLLRRLASITQFPTLSNVQDFN